MFGLPFTFVVQRDKNVDGIPDVVSSVCKFLSNSSHFHIVICLELDLDGMFRISGALVEVQSVISHFDKGSAHFLDYNTLNPHSLCAILKQYFRELPEPIFPFDNYDKYIAIADSQDEAERIIKIKETIDSLPKPNYVLLSFLMKFLTNVAGKAFLL